MWQEIIKTAVGNGLWAVLFCVLLMYQLRDGRARESKYRHTIDVLLDRLNRLDDVERGVRETLILLRGKEKSGRRGGRSEQGETEKAEKTEKVIFTEGENLKCTARL